MSLCTVFSSFARRSCERFTPFGADHASSLVARARTTPRRRFERRIVGRWLFAALAVATLVSSALACSECGCSLSSDWSAQGYPDMPGFTANARFEYYDSNDLRAGTHRVDRAAIALPPDQEIQQDTLNRNTWLGLDYVGAGHWAASAQLPFYDRFHRTIAEGDTAISESHGTGLGDLRLLARYQQYSIYRSFGFQFGLRLPTGRIDQTFASGPQASQPLDRGLQLGNGTTDLLVGASYFRRPAAHLAWFAQITADQPLNERAGFVPSTNVTANTGLRYLNATSVTPQLQFNARWDTREHGANADAPNSGGTVVYASPGVTVELGARSSGYVFVQLPVYRRVNGYQLEPHSLLTIGISTKL